MCVKLTNAGGFEQHRPAVQSGGQKSPSVFLDARLAISTRAHQEIQYPNRVLDFLFCGNFFRAGREEGKCENQSPVLAQARRVC